MTRQTTSSPGYISSTTVCGFSLGFIYNGVLEYIGPLVYNIKLMLLGNAKLANVILTNSANQSRLLED